MDYSTTENIDDEEWIDEEDWEMIEDDEWIIDEEYEYEPEVPYDFDMWSPEDQDFFFENFDPADWEEYDW